MNKVRVGIIGVGEVAELRLIPALRSIPHVTLWGITSRNKERADQLCVKFGAQKTYASYDDTLLDSEIDAVIIATPDKLHARMAIEAARHGKHIFVEKPMATDPEDAKAIVATAKARNVKLAVGYHLRHHAGHQRLREKIALGMLGTPKHVRISWSYNAPENDWRATETYARWWAMAAVGTHALDLATWFLGENGIPEVRSEIFCDEGQLEHSAVVNLKWPSRKTATVVVSNRAKLPRLIEVVGTIYTARCENTLGGYGKGAVSINDIALPFLPVDPYRAELHDFIESIMHDREPLVNGDVGLYNVDLLHLLT